MLSVKSRSGIGKAAVWFSVLLAWTLAAGISPAAAVEIEFWYGWGGSNGDVLFDLVKRFEAENPDVVVNASVTSNLQEKLIVGVLADTGPDAALVDRFQTASLAAQGTLASLEDLIERDGLKPEDFLPSTWAEAEFRGVSYGIPFTTGTRALWYHVGIFRESGLDPDHPPSTWKDLEENAAKVTRRTGTGELVRVGYVPHWGSNFVHYLWQSGGSVLNEDQTQVAFNTDAGLAALEWMADFVDWYGGVEVVQAFISSITARGPLAPVRAGYQAIRLDPVGTIGGLRRDFPDFYANDVRVAPPPMNTERATLSGGFSLSIPRGVPEEKREAAWRLIKFLVSEEAQLAMGVGTGNIPALRRAAIRPEYMDDDVRRVFVEATAYGHFRDNHPAYPEIEAVLLGPMTQQVLNKVAAAPGALEEAARQTQAILDRVNAEIAQTWNR